MPQSYIFCGEPMYAPRFVQNDDVNAESSARKEEEKRRILSILHNGKSNNSETIILICR
jgi:hypothetical protein